MKEEKLIRFLNNKSSKKEIMEVLDWLNRPGSDKAFEEILQKTWINDIPFDSRNEASYAKMLERIHHATTVKKKGVIAYKNWIRWARVAASYLFLLFAAYFLFHMWRSYEPPVELTTTIERTTAAGEKLTIRLPDQSKVILNSLSTIRFDSDFGKTKRLVHLDGEGYFEIKPDKDRPFVVQAQDVTTTALGTAFNIASRNRQVAVSLTEGKVSVSHDLNEVNLNPGQMALLNNVRQGELELISFDPAVVTAWKDGKISFKSKPFGEILADLEDWYGLEFLIIGNVDLKQKVTGLFDNNSLKDIINGLSFSLNLEYSINRTNVIIQPKRL